LVQPFEKISAAHAIFAAEASVALLSPTCDSYPFVTKYIASEPFMNKMKLPLVKSLLHSGNPKIERVHRVWLFNFLVSGLRTSQDVALYQNNHLLEVAMNSVESYDPFGVSELALSMIHRACLIPRAARSLAEDSAIISWLGQYISFHVRIGVEELTITLASRIQMAVNALQILSSWKGVIERGSVKDREQAKSEIALALESLITFDKHKDIFNPIFK